MSRHLSTGVPAAAGYPQYSGNLITPKFGMDLIEQFYCSTVFGDITTTDYIGELAQCGDQITFWREPEVEIRDHVKDGTIKHDTIESRPVTLTIDKAKQFSIKIAKVDQHQICNWDMWERSMLERAARRAAEEIDCDILGEIYPEADRFNRGATAGVCSGCYNLGETGAPLQVDPDNVLDVLLSLQAVLDEQCVPQEDRWIVVPPKMKNTILSSELRSVCFSGLAQSTALNGKMPNEMAGFNVYVSNKLTQVIDPGTNLPTYNIIAGYKGSAVFASQMESSRVIEDKDSWDTYFQGLMVYGHGVIHPEGLVHLYANVS